MYQRKTTMIYRTFTVLIQAYWVYLTLHHQTRMICKYSTALRILCFQKIADLGNINSTLLNVFQLRAPAERLVDHVVVNMFLNELNYFV